MPRYWWVYLCPRKSECFNNRGSFTCECKFGYTMHSNNTCIDVDECPDETPCDFTSSLCVNKDNGFKCKYLDEFNEKKKMVHVLTSMSTLKTCGPRANCVDLPGRFECSWRITETDNCVEYAPCTKASQLLSCECNNGYEDDDKIGDKVDHCVRGIHNFHPMPTCINEGPTFRCDCKNGYNGHGAYCNDINECQSDQCEDEQYGDNIPDSFAVYVDMDIEKRKIQSIKCITISMSVYLAWTSVDLDRTVLILMVVCVNR